MSRSYKHTPISKDWAKSSKLRKLIANRRLRRTVNLDWGSGKSAIYKKYSESWDIHDYVYRWSRKEAIESWYREECYCRLHSYDLSSYGWHKDYATVDEFLNRYWRKCILSK